MKSVEKFIRELAEESFESEEFRELVVEGFMEGFREQSRLSQWIGGVTLMIPGMKQIAKGKIKNDPMFDMVRGLESTA